MCVTRERPGEARPDPVTKQGNWIFGHVAPGASTARPGSPSPPIRPLPWGRIPFPCPQDILAENVGWWWVNDKRCRQGSGECHGRLCVRKMVCDWEGGQRFSACAWDESRTFVVDKHRTPLPGCDQLLLTKGRRIQRRQIGQAARCDRQPASLFDNNSAVYPAPNVLLPFSSVFAVAACRSILVPPARVCLACLPWVGRSDQSGGVCHRRTPLLLSGRCLSRRVALERGVCVSVPISCAPVTRSLRYALTD